LGIRKGPFIPPELVVAKSVDYIFGKGVSGVLPLSELEFRYSARTGRLRYVLHEGRLLMVFRKDGTIAITLEGARLLKKHPDFEQNCVVVKNEYSEFIARGRNLFAGHVKKCGKRVRPGSEVVVVDEDGNVLAVGRAVLGSGIMEDFKSGVAVLVRKGVRD
jgi:uncharacterized protein with predicted RNA binding PUA domain